MKISAHITYREATRSITATKKGIKNKPSKKQLKNMILVANRIFEPLRHHFGDNPIKVTSFYRSRLLNTLIGGSFFSQHCKGQAIDIKSISDKYSNRDYFYFIKNHLPFDQLIWEYGDDNNPRWIHVSYSKKRARKIILRTYVENGKTKYRSF